ncbi:MAG: hypothetical protein JXA20_08970 [Spirochaetes bacterium]|nr:hypothetical protein [Spirochaetota bacterium]
MRGAGDEVGKERSFQYDFFDTTSVADFTLRVMERPPRGYPVAPVRDRYSASPFERDFRRRREELLRHCARNPAGSGIKGYYYELARIYRGKGPVHRGAIRGAIRYINERRDCADFVMLGIVRMLYQFGGSPLVGRSLREEARRTLLDFKYWPDEPGIDSMCTWTENHQIMFSCNEYLAGQLYRDEVFTNSGMTGLQKMTAARRRILQWLDLRYRTGFSEWLSHVYYDEDLTALVNLVDFCGDPVIARSAEIILDLLFLDMALNSFRGTFGSTHGRSYRAEKQDGAREATADIQKLMFGMGIFSGADNMSAVSFALSERYRLPRVIYEIATDIGSEAMENRQRMGIRIREASRWGLDLSNPDDLMTLLSLESYAHPKTFRGVMGLFDRYRWWDNQFFISFRKNRTLIRFLLGTGLSWAVTRYFRRDMTRNTREEVNIRTYRTPDYMLSSAQDYRKGYGGDQQHIWQATLSPDAVCFTTHPGHDGDTSGGYWVGSGTLPRVGQTGNLLIAVYRVSGRRGIYMTNRLFFSHAWFPRHAFDEVVEEGGWIFGRKGRGYIALYSRNGYRWQDRGEYAGSEVIAPGRRNVWLCEMGRKATDGPFADFIDRIVRAEVRFWGLRVRYDSPSQGKVRFGWRGPLTRRGRAVPTGDFGRYENPYVAAGFPPGEILVQCRKERLRLDFRKGVREASLLCQ